MVLVIFCYRGLAFMSSRLGKLSFLAYVISRKRSANQQNQLQNHVFHVKAIQSAEN